VQKFVSGLCDLKDTSPFMSHIRDFLVQSKEFADESDLELLFTEEREAEEQAKRNALLSKHAGLIFYSFFSFFFLFQISSKFSLRIIFNYFQFSFLTSVCSHPWDVGRQ
jgi:hypothetical protein